MLRCTSIGARIGSRVRRGRLDVWIHLDVLAEAAGKVRVNRELMLAAVLDVLRDFAPRTYRFNEEAMQLLEQFHVPKNSLARLAEVEPDRDFTETEMEQLLAEYRDQMNWEMRKDLKAHFKDRLESARRLMTQDHHAYADQAEKALLSIGAHMNSPPPGQSGCRYRWEQMKD